MSISAYPGDAKVTDRKGIPRPYFSWRMNSFDYPPALGLIPVEYSFADFDWSLFENVFLLQ